MCAALGTHLAVLPQVLTWFPIADQDLQSWVSTYLPALLPRPVRTVVCADGYTVDDPPARVRAGPGRGRGGRRLLRARIQDGVLARGVAADLITEGTTVTDVSFMNPARFLTGDVLAFETAVRS